MKHKLTWRDYIAAPAITLGLGFLLWAILTAIAAAQISVPLVRVSGASGTLIAKDRVMTACHVVTDKWGNMHANQPCRFDFLPGIQRTGLEILAYSPEHRRDIAIFTIAPVNATPITIASAIPRVGETVHVAGYAPDGRISSTGRMLGTKTGRRGITPRMLLGVSINLGDSGGCVLNNQREFCGVLCAKDTEDEIPGNVAYASPVTTNGPFSRWLGGSIGGGIGIGGNGGCPNCPPGQCPQERGGGSGQWRQGRDSIIPGPYQDSPLTPDPPPGYGQLVPIPPRQQPPPPRQQPPPPSISGDCQRQLDDLKRQIAALSSGSTPDCSDCLSRVAVLKIEVTELRAEMKGLRSYHDLLTRQFEELLAVCQTKNAPVVPEVKIDELTDAVLERLPPLPVRKVRMKRKGEPDPPIASGSGWVSYHETVDEVYFSRGEGLTIRLFPPE